MKKRGKLRMMESKGIRIGGLIVAMLLVSMAFMPAVSATEVEVHPVPDSGMIMVDNEVTVTSDAGFNPDMDFAKLKINPRYSNIQLKPGSSDEITVTVTNTDNITITAEPKVVTSPYEENILEESWVSITPASKDLGPDVKQEFTIKVNIPQDADIGNYGADIAFTDDVMPTQYPTPYPAYINSMHLYVDVWTPPKIQIQTPYLGDRVKAGDEYDYEIKLKNVVDKDIAIDPKMSDDNQRYYYGPYDTVGPAFDDDAITITAPSIVKAGETAVVKVHLEVPDDAKGRYNGAIDLNIDDPSIREWDGQVQMNFEVWTQPSEPYTKTFTTRTGGPITIEVSSNDYNYGIWMGAGGQDEKDEASFDLALEYESGEVELNLVKTTYSGTVSLGASDFPPWEMDGAGIYHDAIEVYTETYEAPGAIGEWTLGILPTNAEQFNYLITIGAVE
ncbi:hypothetical protein FTO70_16305 [Methanosarcina sp. KYL-1]|uniref:COG1470 family protein n=1 Tax=Methanosarcina sp. KYL-1 TaxID=2602068 RepID=UPI002101BDF5|nr:hypothetical protein [Methanosarcina sp. KYL-1]MCQ1537208.1 hypothetical protein [Methanosarcina sp. KYL-1]